MIDMVGIGPFVTMSIIVGYMHGPGSIFAWLLGALLAYMDGMVWAELGAKWPEAGGSYVFLRKLYGSEAGKDDVLFVYLADYYTGAVGNSKWRHWLFQILLLSHSPHRYSEENGERHIGSSFGGPAVPEYQKHR